LPELAESLNCAGKVRLVGDETISPGGAKLQTAGGEIDATIETQLSNVVEALVGTRVGADAVGSYVPVRETIADCGLRNADCRAEQSAE
jgi:hypothetical protein